MKKLIKMATVAMLSVVTLVGCQSNNNTSKTEDKKEAKVEQKQENKELKTVNVAYMPNMGSASAIVAAMDQGFFKEMGLDVKLHKFAGGPPEIAALNSGEMDIAQIGHGAHKLCIEGKAHIFQMDATSLADAVMGNVEKGVKTIKDLKGKTIATTAGTSADVILSLALKEAGLTREDVKIQEMDADGVVPAMVSGKIDACATWSPSTVTIAEKMKDKVVTLVDNSNYVDQATFPSSFISTKKYAKDNRDVLVKFAAAIQKGQDFRLKDIDTVAKGVAKLTETKEEVMLKAKNEGNWKTSGTEFFKKGLSDGTIKKFYENQQKLFLDAGVVKEKVSVENYVDLSIMTDANNLATK